MNPQEHTWWLMSRSAGVVALVLVAVATLMGLTLAAGLGGTPQRRKLLVTYHEQAANAGLEEKNPAAFAFLQRFQLTTEQQNEIAAMVDADGMEAADAAAEWVEANPDVVEGWLG